MKRFLSVIFAVVLCISCKKTVTTENGVRIVSLAPAITSILFECGAGDAVVGVTDFCEYKTVIDKRVKNHSLLRVGGFSAYNLELIASLNPTAIFCTDSTSIELYNNLIATFGQDKIHAFIHPEDFHAIFAMIKEISNVAGHGDEGTALANRLETQYNELYAKTAGIPLDKRPKVLIELYYPPFMTAGTTTFLSEMVSIAGGTNAIQTATTQWPTITMESIYKTDPDIILKLDDAKPDGTLTQIRAYKTDKVYTPDNFDIFLQPGIYSVDAAVLLYNYIEHNRNFQ